MSDLGKAVFLSYASQDAEAARRICEALRSGGVDVWFDADGGLEHGDEWDQKIRRQIKECVLFIPVISANTQARHEGYFRIEWELAAQRAMGIASGVPFILPVVIDDTREPDALVPDRFRAVQWTRLRNGEVPPEVQQRFLKLWSHRTGVLKQQELEPGRPRPGERGEGVASPANSQEVGRRVPAAAWSIAVTAIALAAVGYFWLRRPAESAPRPAQNAGAGTRPAATTTAAPSEADQLVERARSRRIETRDELIVASDLAKRATDLAPDSARAWAVRAYLEGQFILRGWDISEQRRQDTQAFANRALAIDPNATDAMYALAVVLQQQGAHAQVEALMRRAIALDPNIAALRLALGVALSGQGREAEALAVREETLRRFPNDPLAHYDLALSYERAPTPDFAAALRKFDDSIALQSFTSTVLHKVSLLAGWNGDLPAARMLLDKLDPLDRAGDRAVGIAMMIGLLEHQPERAIEAGELTARNYLEDDYVRGPKAWLMAQAYAMANKQVLAQAQWREAERLLRDRARATPGNWFDEAGLAVTLAWLGEADEAARIMAPLESVARESPQPTRTLYLAYYHAGRGDAAKTVAGLRPILNRRELLTDRTLPLDPWWDKLRGQPAFDMFLAEAKVRAQKPEDGGQKTVALALSQSNGLSPARDLAEKARTLLQGIDATREDFALAEDYCQRALKLDSTDGEVWAAYSQLCSAFGYRGWDTSPERREQTRVMAERAIRLAPVSAQAKLAQAGAWTAFGINRAETEKLLREVVQERPNDPVALRFLAVTVLGRGGLDECLALNERAAALPGGDALALYNNARYLWQRSRQAEAYATLQRSLAQKPFSSSLVLKVIMEMTWRGDLATAEATLKQIPQSAQLEDRANYTAGLVRFYQRNADAALEAWGAFPRDYYNDFQYDGPKGLLIGLADELDHRDAAAKIEWRAALQAVEKRLAATPNNPTPYFYKAYLLACLGEKAAAEEVLRTHEQLAGVKYTAETPMAFDLALVYARLGRFDDLFAHPPTNNLARIRIDPRFDAFRADPRYEKLLAEIQRQKAEAKK